MRALLANRPGPLHEVLEPAELPTPEPAAGEVLVRMLLATVNPSDSVTVSGAYASRTTFPLVPGFEGVGRVVRLGDGVDEQLLGARVLPIGTAGGWAEYKVCGASWCVPVPDALPDESACLAYVNPMTAWLMVQHFATPRVRSVAVTAATSTIGAHLAQLLAERGVRPVAVVRGTPGSGLAEPGLWAGTVSTAEPDWPEQLRALAPGGLDVVFDAVGGPQGEVLVDALAGGGVLVHYGLLSGVPLPTSCFDHRHGTRVEMFRLRDVVHATPHDQLPSLFAPVLDRLAQGLLRSPVGARTDLAGLPAVLAHPVRGKVLVRIG